MVRRKKKSAFLIIIPTVFILIAALLLIEFCGIFRKKNTVEIYINQGEYFDNIANDFYDNNIIGNRFFFKVYAKLFYGDKINHISAGAAEIRGYRSYPSLIGVLLSKQRIPGAVAVTIPEGMNIKEIKARLAADGLIDSKKFDDAVNNHDFGYSWESDFPQGSNRLEGFLFPDTYYFSKEDGEIKIIAKMLDRFDEKIKPYMSKIEKSGFTLYEAITFASIIEKEGADKDDFPIISSVFHNRLKRTDHLKYLQSCATVQYLLSEKKSVLSKADTQIDSPYNTYKYPGLPIGPIASPGEAAIEAALNPADTEYLYFQNDNAGKLHFSKDYDTHLDKLKEIQN